MITNEKLSEMSHLLAQKSGRTEKQAYDLLYNRSHNWGPEYTSLEEFGEIGQALPHWAGQSGLVLLGGKTGAGKTVAADSIGRLLAEQGYLVYNINTDETFESFHKETANNRFFQVSPAQTTHQILEDTKKAKPDIVIVDTMRPDISETFYDIMMQGTLMIGVMSSSSIERTEDVLYFVPNAAQPFYQGTLYVDYWNARENIMQSI